MASSSSAAATARGGGAVEAEPLATIISPLLTPEDGTITSQASLYLAKNLNGETLVLKRTTARTKDLLSSAQNEVSLLRRIRHPNIVQFCGVWTRALGGGSSGSEINLLMELCPGGNLLDLRRRREQSLRKLTEQEIIRLFVQACRGVECLHRFDPPVAHRDVKLENLLLGGLDGRTVKLCDLGSATTRRVLVVSKEDRIRLEDEVVRLTTPAYRAPELVDFYSRKLVSEQVDVWALGCVLFALAFGYHLFGERVANDDEGRTNVPQAILGNKFQLPQEPYFSDEFQLILFWLLESDPNIRPRIGDVVDELDRLLGNKIKQTADKRGSGSGLNRSASKAACLLTRREGASSSHPRAMPATSPIRRDAPSSSSTMILPPPPPMVAASAHPAATPIRARKAQAADSSTNPFDELLPPSANPTFFSNPGMTSESLASFSSEQSTGGGGGGGTFASQVNFSSAVSMMSLSGGGGGLPPSQAPIFFSDPPPQWRPTNNNNGRAG